MGDINLQLSVPDFSDRDKPSRAFIDEMQKRFPTERETDALLVRKLERRGATPPYQRPSLADLSKNLHAMLDEVIQGEYEVSGQSWFSGGVSKIQMGFTLAWEDPKVGARRERLVIRMDPSESHNATSRVREWELLKFFSDSIPVPEVFFLDPDGRWFPEPAIIYSFVEGVTKPTGSNTGQVSGIGTHFGTELRAKLAPQYMRHLALIHTADVVSAKLPSLDVPRPGTTEGALWQVNRARRVWEEDRGEDFPLMDVAACWLKKNLPITDHVAIVHGDYRSGNFLFDQESGQITAWLDWERGHLGDRHRDLTWITQREFGHYDRDGKTYLVCGLIPLHEFYDQYTHYSGLSVDPDRLAYYRVLNCYQILGSLIASAYRVSHLGKTHQDVLLARVMGMAPSVASELVRLLEEVG